MVWLGKDDSFQIFRKNYLLWNRKWLFRTCIFFSYLICPWWPLFILVYSFINKYLLTLFIVLQILERADRRRSWYFQRGQVPKKTLMRVVWMRVSWSNWILEHSVDTASSFIRGLKHTHFCMCSPFPESPVHMFPDLCNMRISEL